ncbi:MAG: alkaline phosphatase family protein [Coraliomargarita sp.]
MFMLFRSLFVLLSTPFLLLGEAPKLVLQITVDQLRGDQLTRFVDRMPEGGFRYFLDQGVVFADAHHPHANTETIVGHATLATGAYPSIHGMIGNVWYDRESGQTTYNIEDSNYALLTADADVDDANEIDPTQRVANTDGRSPMALLSSTFADELAVRTAGQAKIFGVSVKDRGAVSMAGHAGKAFWFSKQAGEFVTSTYYYDAYPDWVLEWNAAGPTEAYAGQFWTLLNERSSYLYADRDDQEWETALPGFGRTFPHAFGSADSRGFTTYLTLSPAGDQMTLEFAKALIANEGIGDDEVTDYLSVSFSSTDYVGHIFGPSSLEAEDNLLQLDRTLAGLLTYVDERIGLSNTLIVLSSDHGGPEAPGVLQQYGFGVNYVEPDTWDKSAAFERLKQRFGIGESLIETYSHPYIYLNKPAIEERGLDLAQVQRAVAAELLKFEGVALAVASQDLTTGNVPDTELHRAVLNNYHAKRSGEVYVVYEPQWFIADFDGLHVACTHGSPWRYDTYVPIVFAGAQIAAKTVYRRVETVDIAATLSAYLGMQAPSGCVGEVLPEVFE